MRHKIKVGVVVVDVDLKREIEEALARHGAIAVSLTHVDAFAGTPHTISAAVVELAGSLDDGIRRLRQCSRHFRRMPILAYVPLQRNTPAVRMGVAGLEHVLVRPYVPRVSGPSADADVREMISMIPAEKLLGMLELLDLGECPLPDDTARCIVRCVTAGISPTALSTTFLARQLGMQTRMLQRKMQDLGLVPPKQYVRWITLLLAAKTAEFSGTTTAKAAQWMGLSAVALYRLRKALLPDVPTPRDPQREYDLAFLAFAGACHASGHATMEVLRQASGDR